MEEDMALKALAEIRIAGWPSLLATAAMLMLPVSSAHADIIEFLANLTGAADGTTSPGTGTAEVVLNTTTQTIEINVTFSGLTSNSTAAHIHCCAPLGTNAPVTTTAPAFNGFPLGVTSGSLDQTYDMTLPGSYLGAFLTANGGSTAAAFSTLLTGMRAGQAYLNIHTVNNGGG